MTRTVRYAFVAGLALLVAAPSVSVAEVKLPAVIASNMVLQRDMPVPIWGTADAGEKVTVAFAGQTKTATADESGRWIVRLDPLKASAKGRTLVVQSAIGNRKSEMTNVLVGEVWVGSGQSNMQWSVTRALNPKEEVAAAKWPKIRLFYVPRKQAITPQPITANWTECSPKTVGGFSAVLYYFGRHLHKELDVPMGLIATAWGGTRVEPWIPPVGLDSEPSLKPIAEAARKLTAKGNQQRPTVLYNGMVHALVPFAIRGAIWYQGESNMGEGMKYFFKKKALINGWRKVWGQTAGAPDGSGNFSFYLVQLAPFSRYGAGALPLLWEAQSACLTIPNVGMSVTTDITGNLNNIHPADKQNVGKRLALWALAKDYGKRIVYSGPLYKSMAVEGKTIRLTFDSVGGGLVSRDGKALSWFTIAGSDKKFVEATAKIDGKTVVVSCDAVAKPAAVRFGWKKTAVPNLNNKEGLPASPFRTDRW